MKIKERKERKNKKNLVSTLKKYYPIIKFDTLDNSSKYKDNQITYGEINYEGMDTFYERLNEFNINCFIDIGSGRGKLCFYMASKPKLKHVLGIEVVEERHKDSLDIKKKLGQLKKLKLMNDDALNVNFKVYNNFNSCVYFSNLCWNDSFTNKIFQKIYDEFPKGTIICCSNGTNDSKFTFVEKIQIPMSWNANSSLYIYKL
jgi:SAM-dependent methyltransferase